MQTCSVKTRYYGWIYSSYLCHTILSSAETNKVYASEISRNSNIYTHTSRAHPIFGHESAMQTLF